MKKPLKLKLAFILFLILSLLIVVFAAFVSFRKHIKSTISTERYRLEKKRSVMVESISLRQPAQTQYHVNLYLKKSDVKAFVRFGSSYYAATSGGLIVYSPEGRYLKEYTTLFGLPTNDLRSLAVFGGKLFIGTSNSGLLSFDGVSFIHYRFQKPAAERIRALYSTPNELLIGTFDEGLFEFDGAQFSRRYAASKNGEFKQITALLLVGARLYIGTHADGLYFWQEGQFYRFRGEDGLPSNHITALLQQGQTVLVATDFGVASLDLDNAPDHRGKVRVVSSVPNITSLVEYKNEILGGLFTGGLVKIRLSSTSSNQKEELNELNKVNHPDRTELYNDSAGLWALTEHGVYKLANSVSVSGYVYEPFEPFDERKKVGELSDSHITSLAVDWQNRIWVGFFDRGIDLISPDTGELIKHIEDEKTREINFLCPVSKNSINNKMLAATSNGLLIFDENFKRQAYTEQTADLISNSISHAIVLEERKRGFQMALATGKGLTFLDGGIAKSITTFHGLASNYLYTTALVKSRLYVGSLNGLMELEGLRVVRTFTSSNSKLSHNWINALAEVQGTLFIGTNGGGVDALIPTGEIINFSDEIGKFEVNPNAMHFTGSKLYVGTTDRGVFIYDINRKKWEQMKTDLSELCVTSITSDQKYIYFGTTNGITQKRK